MAKLFTKEIKDGDDVCGTVNMYLSEKNTKGDIEPADVRIEGAHVFEFIEKKKETGDKPAKREKKEGADDCCGGSGFGWVQHVSGDGGKTWKYDNAALKPPSTTRGFGADSDPSGANQPTDRPKGKDGTGADRWKENPWYGAPTDPKVDKDEFAVNPKPQSTIGDKPGGDHYRTQLVCGKGGKMFFQWDWDWDKNGREMAPPKK